MTEHRLDWREGRLWCGDVGASDEMAAARQLLSLGLATRDDTIVSYRSEMPCLKMGIGWAADRVVTVNVGGTPVFRLSRADISLAGRKVAAAAL
jgi:hypothetical protein